MYDLLVSGELVNDRYWPSAVGRDLTPARFIGTRVRCETTPAQGGSGRPRDRPPVLCPGVGQTPGARRPLWHRGGAPPPGIAPGSGTLDYA